MLAAHRIMFFETPWLTVAVVFGALVAGLFAGGTAYTVAWRLTNDRHVLGRSYCPHCGHPLTMRETIPLFSWISQRGNCNYCGEPVSMAYPTSELLGAGVFASVILRYGLSMQTLEVLIFAFVLMVIATTSLIDYSIRNSCLFVAVLVRLAYLAMLFVRGEGGAALLASSLVGALALGVPLAIAVFLSDAMLARDISGMGTVKLVAVVGLYLGWQQGLLAIALAFGLGTVVWLVSPYKLLAVEVAGGSGRDGGDVADMPLPRDLRATMEEDIAEPMRMIPFAPSIVIACWGMLLLGISVAAWNAPLF